MSEKSATPTGSPSSPEVTVFPAQRTICAGVAGVAAIVAAVATIAPAAAGADTNPLAAYTRTALLSDTYARTVRIGLGNAPTGGRYVQRVDHTAHALRSTAGATSVSGGSAVFHSVRAGHSVEEVLPRSARDAVASLVVSLPSVGHGKFGGSTGVELRRSSGSTYYLARVAVSSSGTARAFVTRVRSGRSTTLLTTPSLGRVRPGQRVTLQFAVAGTSATKVMLRAWRSGDDTPSWITRTDARSAALTSSGQVGLLTQTNRGASALTTRVESLDAWTLHGRVADTSTSPRAFGKSASNAPVPSSNPTGGHAGSAAIGSTAYPVPTGALFVSTTGSDASGDGSLSRPFATIRAAISHVADGGTIVLRGGVYNQSATIGMSLSNITVQAYPHEAVWFDGSIPLTGWMQTGSGWVHGGWSYQFDSSASFTRGSNAGGFVNPAYPMAAHPDEVFSDGVQLRQVASNPAAGQFAVDYSAHTITVGSDPTTHAMRASNLSQAFVIGGGYVTLRGFGVRDYATPLPAMGTVYQGGNIGHGTFENLVITENATTGLSTSQAGDVINHVTADRNGMSGMQVGTNVYGQSGAGEMVTNCEISYNDTEGFVGGPATSALKVGRLDGITISNNVVQHNFQSSGIWTDQSVTNFVIVDNLVTDNGASYGILTELSNGGVVADNVISGSKYGYTAFDTGNVRVINNTVTANTVWQIGLSQDARHTDSSGPTARAPYLVENVTVENNYLGLGGGFQFYAMDKGTTQTADSMNLLVTGNVFAAPTSSAGTVMVGWGTNHHTVTYYTSPTAFARGTGHGWTNLQSGSSAMTSNIYSASGTNIAVPLAGDVAAMLSARPGTAVVGAF